MIHRYFFRLALLALLVVVLPAQAADLVILVSIDGFRADYLDRGITPTLSRFVSAGAHANVMEPAFPSVTFPNHYTLVTGLTPDHHGVVNNTMRDPAMPGHVFRLSDRGEMANPAWWEGGIPIWETMRRAHLKSGTVFWPGSEMPIHGIQPDYWRPFDGKLPINERVDAVLRLTALPPAERPDLVTLYFDTVDHQGHVAGPDSEEVRQAMKDVDAGLARLESGLRGQNLWAHANVVVVSDHGMAEVSPERAVRLDDLVAAGSYESINGGALTGIYPRGDAQDKLVGALTGKSLPHLQCWRKQDLPARFRFGGNPRVPPIYCLADVGWSIVTGDSKLYDGRGSHGYDPASPEMAALFVAVGPAFKPGAVVERVHAVDVYALLARLLGIRAEANDGDAGAFDSVLTAH